MIYSQKISVTMIYSLICYTQFNLVTLDYGQIYNTLIFCAAVFVLIQVWKDAVLIYDSAVICNK